MQIGANHRRREDVVRIKHVVFVFLLAPSAAIPGHDGAFCTIPKLLPGVPAHVPVEHIDSPFCGVALVDGRYQKIADVSGRQEESPVTCEEAGRCHKTVKYYPRNNAHPEPYIIIFTGPAISSGL